MMYFFVLCFAIHKQLILLPDDNRSENNCQVCYTTCFSGIDIQSGNLPLAWKHCQARRIRIFSRYIDWNNKSYKGKKMEAKNYNYFHKKETLMIFMYYQQEKSQGFHILWFVVSFQKWYIKRVYSQCGGQAKHTFTCNFKKFMIQLFMLNQKSLSWFCCRCKRNSGFPCTCTKSE